MTRTLTEVHNRYWGPVTAEDVAASRQAWADSLQTIKPTLEKLQKEAQALGLLCEVQVLHTEGRFWLNQPRVRTGNVTDRCSLSIKFVWADLWVPEGILEVRSKGRSTATRVPNEGLTPEWVEAVIIDAFENLLDRYQLW
jgi:hypothetical protein